MNGMPWKIIQLSDMHLYANPDETLLGVQTSHSFQAVLNQLKIDNFSPHLILLTGDLSQDSSEHSYIALAEKISQLKVPVYCVPGNHDDHTIMSKIYPLKMISLQKQIMGDAWQVILLDSHQHGKPFGFLEKEELNFLEICLKEYPKHHAIIAFHHQPISVGSLWLDNIGLINADEFWNILSRYPQAHSILFGHVHQEIAGEKNGIRYYSTPSTCIQFRKNSEKFSLEKLPPAYRSFELYPNGNLTTKVRRIKNYIGSFIEDSSGY